MSFYEHGNFLCKDGPAKLAGREHSSVKICFTCRDFDFLKNLLEELGANPECYWIKIAKKDRDGMYLGRAFFTSSQISGQIWAKHRSHPRLLVSLQDDNFANQFRDKN